MSRMDDQVGFRCPAELREWMEKQAKVEKRSLSDWIRLHFEAMRKTMLDKAKQRR